MRSRVVLSGARLAIASVASLVLLLACSDQQPTDVPDSISMAKGGRGPDPVVDAADPPEAPQNTTLDVRVLGANFDNGSKVRFLLGGKPTKNIGTNSTQFVSTEELVANITIALDAATLDYDIEVTTSKKRRGIGTELFKVKSGKGGGGIVVGTLGLAGGMTATDLDVFIGQDSDTKLTVNNGGLDREIQMNFPRPSREDAKKGACTVIFGSTGSRDEDLTNDEWDGLLAELNASSFLALGVWMEIDKRGLGSPSDGNLLQVSRDGTFDNAAGLTRIMLGSPFDEVDPATVVSSGSVDVFEFTGPVVVWAVDVGRKGKRGRRVIACGETGDNTVTVTVGRSPA